MDIPCIHIREQKMSFVQISRKFQTLEEFDIYTPIGVLCSCIVGATRTARKEPNSWIYYNEQVEAMGGKCEEARKATKPHFYLVVFYYLAMVGHIFLLFFATLPLLWWFNVPNPYACSCPFLRCAQVCLNSTVHTDNNVVQKITFFYFIIIPLRCPTDIDIIALLLRW